MTNKKVHGFTQSLNIGKNGQEIIKQYLQNQYDFVVDITKQKEFYSLDIDYLCIDEDNNNVLVEVKTDTYTARNGNIFLETWSNVEKKRKGWPYYTKAHLIHYYAVSSPYSYVFKGSLLEELLELFHEEGEVKKVWNKGYTSEGIVLPLKQIPQKFYTTHTVINPTQKENE